MTIFPEEGGSRALTGGCTKEPLRSAPMPDRHMMVDIETLDTEITAVILSIGAITFDPRASGYEYEPTFSKTVRVSSQKKRTISKSTQRWWENQDAIAYKTAFSGELPIGLALSDFTRWANKLVPTCTRIWAKSPDFDCSILKHACAQEALLWPFKFWDARCCRTIMELAYPLGDFPVMKMEGPKHDALVDAKTQVLEVQHAYHILGA